MQKQQLAYDNFINTIKSKASKITYRNNLQLFMRFVGITEPEALLKINAEESIKDYIVTMRDKVSSATLQEILHPQILPIHKLFIGNSIW